MKKHKTLREVMCGTCGFETDARSEAEADRAHREFDPAHEASWYESDRLIRDGW